MKWREIQIQPAPPAPDAAIPPISLQTQTESNLDSGSDLNARGTSEYPNEAVSALGGSSSSTPRPPSKQAAAHVLIVDDNEINVKVLSRASSQIGALLKHILDYGHFYAKNKLQL